MRKRTETSRARTPVSQSSEAMAVLALCLRRYVEANPERFTVVERKAGFSAIRTVQLRKPHSCRH